MTNGITIDIKLHIKMTKVALDNRKALYFVFIHFVYTSKTTMLFDSFQADMLTTQSIESYMFVCVHMGTIATKLIWCSREYICYTEKLKYNILIFLNS